MHFKTRYNPRAKKLPWISSWKRRPQPLWKFESRPLRLSRSLKNRITSRSARLLKSFLISAPITCRICAPRSLKTPSWCWLRRRRRRIARWSSTCSPWSTRQSWSNWRRSLWWWRKRTSTKRSSNSVRPYPTSTSKWSSNPTRSSLTSSWAHNSRQRTCRRPARCTTLCLRLQRQRHLETLAIRILGPCLIVYIIKTSKPIKSHFAKWLSHRNRSFPCKTISRLQSMLLLAEQRVQSSDIWTRSFHQAPRRRCYTRAPRREDYSRCMLTIAATMHLLRPWRIPTY